MTEHFGEEWTDELKAVRAAWEAVEGVGAVAVIDASKSAEGTLIWGKVRVQRGYVSRDMAKLLQEQAYFEVLHLSAVAITISDADMKSVEYRWDSKAGWSDG